MVLRLRRPQSWQCLQRHLVRACGRIGNPVDYLHDLNVADAVARAMLGARLKGGKHLCEVQLRIKCDGTTCHVISRVKAEPR